MGKNVTLQTTLSSVILFNFLALFFLSGDIIAAPINPVTNETNVRTFVGQGWALENQGKAQEALALYDQALQLNPNNFLVHKHLGIHWIREGNFAQGIRELNKAVELNPSDPSSFYNLGLAYHLAHQYRNALTCYTQAIKLNPKYYNAIHNRGIVYLKLRDYKEAIKDYASSMAMSKDFMQTIPFILLFLFILVVTLSKQAKMNATINNNLRMAAGILHSDITSQPLGRIKSIEGMYKGRKIIIENHSWAKGRKVYLKALLQLPAQQEQKPIDPFFKFFQIPFRRPTKFTNLIGNEIFYGESPRNLYTNYEWQQKCLSQEDVILMFDRLMEGANLVESGGQNQETIPQKVVFSQKIFIIWMGLIFIGVLFLNRKLQYNPKDLKEYLIILLIAVGLFFIRR